jgi:hypothetical protein
MDSEHPFVGAEPACSIPAEVAKKAVRDWTNKGHKKHWESIIGPKTYKGTLYKKD